jgi:hypothetical protein
MSDRIREKIRELRDEILSTTIDEDLENIPQTVEKIEGWILRITEILSSDIDNNTKQ